MVLDFYVYLYLKLTLSTLDKIYNRRQFETFPYLSKKTECDISYKLETICMKCHILFSGKSKKNVINLLSAELAKRVVKVTVKV